MFKPKIVYFKKLAGIDIRHIMVDIKELTDKLREHGKRLEMTVQGNHQVRLLIDTRAIKEYMPELKLKDFLDIVDELDITIALVDLKSNRIFEFYRNGTAISGSYNSLVDPQDQIRVAEALCLREQNIGYQ